MKERKHKTVVIWPTDIDDLIVVGELVDLAACDFNGNDLSHFVEPGGAAVRINTGTLIKALAAMAIRMSDEPKEESDGKPH